MYHLLTVGKGYLFGFNGGVYVINDGGVFGAHKYQMQSCISCAVAEELYSKNKNDLTKSFYKKNLQWALLEYKNVFRKKCYYAWKQFVLCRKIKPFIKSILL